MVTGYSFGVTSADQVPDDRFTPRCQADYDRLEQIARARPGADVWLDVRAVELYLHLSRRTIYRLVKKGVFPCARIGRQIRINKRVIDEVLGAGQGRPA